MSFIINELAHQSRPVTQEHSHPAWLEGQLLHDTHTLTNTHTHKDIHKDAHGHIDTHTVTRAHTRTHTCNTQRQ